MKTKPFKATSGPELSDIINTFSKTVDMHNISYAVQAVNNGVDISVYHYALVSYYELKEKKK